MGTLLRFLNLDFPLLKGARTAIGGVAFVLPDLVDQVTNAGLCVTHPGACAVLRTLASWFLVMGIRGK